MNSRKIEDLHSYLGDRWNLAVLEWQKLYKIDPQPFLTQTYRSFDYQNDLYDLGRTKPGKIVTRAKGGQSLHNYYPALAMDIAFRHMDDVYWNIEYFRRFAAIIKPMGVEWGGDWIGFRDYPHFQVPQFTWRDAAAGKVFTPPVVEE